MNIRQLKEKIIQKGNDPNKFDLRLFPEEFSAKSYQTPICTVHGKFKPIRVDSFIFNYICPKCNKKNRKPNPLKSNTEEYIEACKKVHQNPDGSPKYDYSKTVFTGSNKNIIFTCSIHGDKTIRADMHKFGQGCNECAHQKSGDSHKLTQEEFIKHAQKIHQNQDGTPKYDYSKIKYIRRMSPVTIYCPEHNYEFTMLAHTHLNGGTKCYKCRDNLNKSYMEKELLTFIESIYKSMTIKEFITKFRNKGHEPELFDFSLFPKEFHVMSKQTPICKIHGVFDKPIKVNNFLVRGNCPKCKKESKQITSEKFVSICKKIHQNPDGTPKYDYSKTVYTKAENKVIITCPIHGDFEQRANIHKFGQGCPECGKKKQADSNTLNTEQFVSVCKKIHQNLDGTPNYDYSKTVYTKAENKVIITCPIHGDFEQIAAQHKLGHGCTKCGNENKLHYNTEQFVSTCKKIHKNPDGTPKYDYSKTVYTGSNEFLTIICPKHGEFKQLAAAHKAGKGCYQCGLESPNRYTNTSKQETAVLEDINNLISDKQILQNTRSVIGPKELDIYIPELKLAFEFNGLYWHSEREVPNNNQLQKTEMCESKGIQLIHIYEDDWSEKQSIIKSRIKQLLGKTENKIYARKCKLKIIDSKTERSFFVKNHLQEYVASTICYGLYYQNTLVACMSFGKQRLSLGGYSDKGWELYRYCSLLNTTVIGGASKLFKHFLKIFKPLQIISYADRSWSKDSEHILYRKLGFEFDSYTKPNYHIITGNVRSNRFNFRKSELIRKYCCTEQETEHEFCLKQGWYRIYNSGNLKYIWNK